MAARARLVTWPSAAPVRTDKVAQLRHQVLLRRLFERVRSLREIVHRRRTVNGVEYGELEHGDLRGDHVELRGGHHVEREVAHVDQELQQSEVAQEVVCKLVVVVAAVKAGAVNHDRAPCEFTEKQR